MEPTSIALWLLIIVGVLFIIGKIRDRRLLNSVTKRNRGTKSERDLVLKLFEIRNTSTNHFSRFICEKE